MRALHPTFLSLDLRALALFRIGLGAVFILDLCLRARDLQLFYGDGGVLSRSLFLRQSWLLSEYQLFLATGSDWGLGLLFVLGAMAGISLVAGYRTRLAAFVCWAFTVSIQLRNPMVLDGGDELLRLLLFWCPFLPLSARWSVEAWESPEWRKLPDTYRSIASAGVTVQYSLLYLFAAILKSGEEWRTTGTALYYTLSIDQFATHLGKWMLNFPQLMKAATFVALGTELCLGILILVSPRYWKIKTVVVAGALCFHLGIALLLNFGIFQLIAAVGLLAFIPGTILDRWFAKAQDGQAEAEPPGYRLNKAEILFGAFIIFYIIFVNVQSIRERHRLPGWTKVVARITFQHQHWHLFAPRPFRDDGWFVFEVTDSNGRIWRSLGAPDNTLEKPSHVADTFPNHRWRRWLQNLVLEPFEDTQSWRNSTALYLANRWISDNPKRRLVGYRLLFMKEFTTPPGEEPSVETVVLAESARND